MSLDIYPRKGEFPLIAAFTLAGDRLMMPFRFDGKELQRFEPVHYHSGIFNNYDGWEGVVWTVDMNGVLKRLCLND